ncbi:hypothetical protein ABZ896_36760 [Streptomyces sp. NPDC047072]|uniref:hypothetical protein n=1 Tax=Streptomyces sp. NPDC047072 TaxID=3154809 RepID=UPI0033F2B9B5
MFGERAVSWRTVWDELFPDPEAFDGPHDDNAAAEMNRLRGLVMAQASETETVLGMILGRLVPSARTEKPAGALLRDVRTQLSSQTGAAWADALDLIDKAIKRRNHVVHNAVVIGSSWREYATGDGGDWIPVISFMGDEEYSETELLDDLTLQHEATAAAVRVLHSLS